jgi:hypothetical protein
MGKKTRNWVAERLLLYGGVGVVFYIIGDALNVIPRSVKDGVSWTAANFGLLAFLFCFTIGTYVILKIYGNQKEKKRYGEY